MTVVIMAPARFPVCFMTLLALAAMGHCNCYLNPKESVTEGCLALALSVSNKFQSLDAVRYTCTSFPGCIWNEVEKSCVGNVDPEGCSKLDETACSYVPFCSTTPSRSTSDYETYNVAGVVRNSTITSSAVDAALLRCNGVLALLLIALTGVPLVALQL
jgi:hypothetical protein